VSFSADEEDCIAEKQVPGHLQAGEEDLRMGNFGKLATGWRAQRHVVGVHSDGGAIGVVLFFPSARALLFLVSTSWTVFFLFIIQRIPYDIRLI